MSNTLFSTARNI